jgi:hypothetical protein
MDVITLLDDNHSCFHTAFKELPCDVRGRLWIHGDVGLLQGSTDPRFAHLVNRLLNRLSAMVGTLLCQDLQGRAPRRRRLGRILDWRKFRPPSGA